MIIKKGAHGAYVIQIQKALDKHGFWTYPKFTKNFGSVTDAAVRNFQKVKGLSVDGKIGLGGETEKALGIKIVVPKSKYDETYKDVVIEGATFPGKPVRKNLNVKLNKHIRSRYLPAMEKVMVGQPLGFKLLITVMAQKEGYYPGTRSYRTNNPGNIGNTDSGRNTPAKTLEEGILRQ